MLLLIDSRWTRYFPRRFRKANKSLRGIKCINARGAFGSFATSVQVPRSRRLLSHPSKSRVKAEWRERKRERKKRGIFAAARDRKSPIVIIISTIYPPLARIKLRKAFTRAFTRVLLGSRGRERERKTREGARRGRAGVVSRERDSKGARRGAEAWATRDHHDKSFGANIRSIY